MVDVSLSAAQQALGEAAGAFLRQEFPPAARRRLLAGDRSGVRPLWQRAQALGLIGLLIPEELGGGGLSPVDLLPVFAEFGRALAPGPLVETAALAVSLLTGAAGSATPPTAAAGDPAHHAREVLQVIAAGELLVAAALPAESDLAAVTAAAVPQPGGGYTLHGSVRWVADADVADRLLVAARTPDGGLLACLVPAASVECEPTAGLDCTRRFAHIHLAGAMVEPEATLPGAALTPALRCATVAHCAAMLGGAEAALAMAVAHAQTRRQFDTVIGKFQAIKHRCADMLVQLENARSLLWYAAWAVAAGDPGATAAVAAAKSYGSQAFTQICSDNIQIHGGIGFTWEHDAHLYLRRARASEVQYGPPRLQREHLAAALGW